MATGQIQLLFRDNAKCVELRQLCIDALKYVYNSDQRLLCIFDDEERREFTERPGLGASYRGFHFDLRDAENRTQAQTYWPSQILSHILQGNDWQCEHVIYLRKSTLQSSIGTLITLENESRHFWQSIAKPKTMRANRDLKEVIQLYCKMGEFEKIGDLTNQWLLPIEHDAWWHSRNYTRSIFGEECVAEFARHQIGSGDNPAKWQFFLDIDTSRPYDLPICTMGLIDRYRTQLRNKFDFAFGTHRYQNNDWLISEKD